MWSSWSRSSPGVCVKCRTCGQVAVINMRHHKLALCGEHYLEWLPAQVQRFVEKQKLFTPHDRLLVAVSGGKDSLSLWDILLRLGYQAAGLMQNMLRWQTGYLARQSPLLESTHPKFARKVKPLARVYEREMAAYALVRGIDYIYEECPFSVGATTLFHKTLLNQLEAHSPGAKLA